MHVTGNTIFIPGSTSGIGLALALRLHTTGNAVVVGGRRTELLEQIAAEHPDIDTVQIDTADAASVRSAAGQVLARMTYEHPVYDRAALAAQRRLPELNDGVLAFAGAYHGWGFHEDGCRAGLAAAESLGGYW